MSAIVPAGYKQTEVGVIPMDWSVGRCKELCIKIQDGTHFSPTIWGNDFLYVTSKNIRFGYFDVSTAERIDAIQHDSIYKRCDVRYGDLLLTKDGANTGNAAINDLHEQFSLLSSVAFLRFDQNRHNASYFLQQVLSASGQRQIKVAMSGNAITRLTLEKINKLKFPTAPVSEQRAIAAALSDVDALLAKLDALVAKKRDLKQAAMQQLLTGQTRLPGFSGAWEVRPLASVVANLEAGVSVNSVEYGAPLGSGEQCILKTSAIFDGRFDPEECKLIDYRDLSRAKLNPRKDTIIISRMNTPNLVGEVGYVSEDFPTLCLPDRLWMTRFVPGADVSARWLAYVMSSAHIKENIKGLATGTSGSMKNIGKAALLALQLKFPTGEEQTAIATILSDMDAELAALEARRDKTRALKQGMMQELLTGRIRLV